MFKDTTSTMIREIHAAILMPWAPFQYWMIRAAAEISAHKVIDDWYQLLVKFGVSKFA